MKKTLLVIIVVLMALTGLTGCKATKTTNYWMVDEETGKRELYEVEKEDIDGIFGSETNMYIYEGDYEYVD